MYFKYTHSTFRYAGTLLNCNHAITMHSVMQHFHNWLPATSESVNGQEHVTDCKRRKYVVVSFLNRKILYNHFFVCVLFLHIMRVPVMSHKSWPQIFHTRVPIMYDVCIIIINNLCVLMYDLLMIYYQST